MKGVEYEFPFIFTSSFSVMKRFTPTIIPEVEALKIRRRNSYKRNSFLPRILVSA